MAECYTHNKTKVVSESFIVKNHLEYKRQRFTPLCPPPSCCTTAGLLDGKILCTGGGLGKPACDTTTCTWIFDCSNPKMLDHSTIMETPIAKTSAPTVTNAAPVTNAATVINNALASDPNSFSGSSDGSNPSASNALIGLSVVATILVVVVLVLAIMFVRKNQTYVLLVEKP